MTPPPKVYSRNLGPIPRCPHAATAATHTLYTDDGAHRWGDDHGRNPRRGDHAYTCQDCELTMTVDSGD